MDLKQVYITDIETKGLLPMIDSPYDLHVMSTCVLGDDGPMIASTNDLDAIVSFITNSDNNIVGHNFYLFDAPALEKMLKVEFKAEIIDTLLLSWYLEPNRYEHGLEVYGEEYGVPKPEINDWKGLSYEEYKHRCEEDVKINTNLIYQQYNDLKEMYPDEDHMTTFVKFLMTKGKVYKQHYDNPLRLDIGQCEKNLEELQAMAAEKEAVLIEAMPKNLKKAKKRPPKNMYKQDGSLSAHGEKWHTFLLEQGLPSSYEGEVEYISGYDTPKPTSTAQVKDWLFSLGWEPDIYNDVVNKSGPNSVPQIKDKEKNLCKSVLALVEKEPAIKELEDLTTIIHRAGYLKGFLKNHDSDGNITADMAGFTNTLRIKHRNLVNLPQTYASYGKYVRSVLLPPEGHIMIGSDLSGLESVTRNNFVIDYDPEFVSLQDHPYYDPHLEIAVIAGMMSEDDSNFYKWWKAYKKDDTIRCEDIAPDWVWTDQTDEYNDKLHNKLDRLRHAAKTTNYSSLYGIGATKLSKELKIPYREAKGLIQAYWKKNWSVKHFSSRCKTRHFRGQLWVQNPLNNFWYSLRNEKDIFSTVNQSAGDYIFTLWQHNLMKLGLKLRAGFHDEVVVTCPPKEEQETIDKLYEAIDLVNRQLGLKVPVGIDHKVGTNYGDVH